MSPCHHILNHTMLPPLSQAKQTMGTGTHGKKARHSAKKKQYKKALCTKRRPKDIDQIQVRMVWVWEGGRMVDWGQWDWPIDWVFESTDRLVGLLARFDSRP